MPQAHTLARQWPGTELFTVDKALGREKLFLSLLFSGWVFWGVESGSERL